MNWWSLLFWQSQFVTFFCHVLWLLTERGAKVLIGHSIHGYMNTRIPRCMNTCIHGYMDMWLQEYKDKDRWRHGYMNTCICGYMDTWIPGYQDARIPKYMCTWIHGVEVHREPFTTPSLFLFLAFCFYFYVYFFLSSFWACYWKVESTHAVFLLLTESSPQERCANRHFICLYLAQTMPLQRDLLLAF